MVLSDLSISLSQFRYILKMAKVNKVGCKADSRQHRVTPHALSSCSRKAVKRCHLKKKHSKASEKKDWEGATCSVWICSILTMQCFSFAPLITSAVVHICVPLVAGFPTLLNNTRNLITPIQKGGGSRTFMPTLSRAG